MGFPVCARFAHPDGGWPGEGARAAEVLTPGGVYTIRELIVGSSSSRMTFDEVPGEFNSVLFEPAYAEWDEEFPATWAGGHALIIESGDSRISARCQCAAPLGSGAPDTSLDEFSHRWERHVMTREHQP
jgi:hypothetical protein